MAHRAAIGTSSELVHSGPIFCRRAKRLVFSRPITRPITAGETKTLLHGSMLQGIAAESETLNLEKIEYLAQIGTRVAGIAGDVDRANFDAGRQIKRSHLPRHQLNAWQCRQPTRG